MLFEIVLEFLNLQPAVRITLIVVLLLALYLLRNYYHLHPILLATKMLEHGIIMGTFHHTMHNVRTEQYVHPVYQNLPKLDVSEADFKKLKKYEKGILAHINGLESAKKSLAALLRLAAKTSGKPLPKEHEHLAALKEVLEAQKEWILRYRQVVAWQLQDIASIGDALKEKSGFITHYLTEERYVQKKHRHAIRNLDITFADLPDLTKHEVSLVKHLEALQKEKNHIYPFWAKPILSVMEWWYGYSGTGVKRLLSRHEAGLHRMYTFIEQQHFILREYHTLIKRQLHAATGWKT